MKLITMLLLALLALLAGCASGVAPLTDAEAVACRNDGCATFTEAETLTLMGKAYKDGYLKGWADYGRQSGGRL